MNTSDFREIRDTFAEKSMLERLEKLKTESAAALSQAKALRTRMKHTPKGQKRDLVEIDYDRAMVAWAKYECLIGNIERDSRYIAYLERQADNQS